MRLVLQRCHKRNQVSQIGTPRVLQYCYSSIFHTILVRLYAVRQGFDYYVLSYEGMLTKYLSVRPSSSNIKDGIPLCWETSGISKSCPSPKDLQCTMDLEASKQLIGSRFQEGKVLITLAGSESLQIEILYYLFPAPCCNYLYSAVNQSIDFCEPCG